jgi:hypothetical protein
VDPGIQQEDYHTAKTTTLKSRTVIVATTSSHLARVTLTAEGHKMARCLMLATASPCHRLLFISFVAYFIISSLFISFLLTSLPFFLHFFFPISFLVRGGAVG